MMEGISKIPASSNLPLQALVTQSNPAARDEFVALFYKEILKQAFKTPNLTMGEEEENNSFGSVFSSDLLVGKLALELARSQSFSAANLFPDDLKEGKKTE